jgi:hypothetical protein
MSDRGDMFDTLITPLISKAAHMNLSSSKAVDSFCNRWSQCQETLSGLVAMVTIEEEAIIERVFQARVE